MICIDGHCTQDLDRIPVSWLSSEGFQFGLGVFETLRLVSGIPEDLELHLNRLRASAETLGIALPDVLMSPLEVARTLAPLLETTESSFSVLKIGLIKDKGSSHWWAQVRPFLYERKHLLSGFKVNLSLVKRNSSSVLTQHKTMNYAENWLEKQKSVENGYQEVLFLNEDGLLTEGAVSNLFMIKDNKWYTPSLQCGLLNGVMRKRLIDAVKCNNGIVEEGCYTLSFLLDADYVLLTNSLMGIMPVCQLEERMLKAPNPALTAFLDQVDPIRVSFK